MFALNAAEDERLVRQAKSFFAWQRNLPCYAEEGGNRAVLPYKQS
jgi:hypothetical protein